MGAGQGWLRVAVGLGVFAVGCGVYMTEDLRIQKVTDRGKFDLSCQDVHVAKISETTYGAIGCDKKVSYVLVNCETPAVAKECTLVADNAQASAPAASDAK